MNPFDDRIPEELEQENQQLLALLRSTIQKPVSLTSSEQQQVLSTVRERLLQHEDVGEASEPIGTVGNAGQTTGRFPAAPRKGRSLTRFFNTLAAVLVIGAFIGASLLLFTRHQQTGVFQPTVPTGSPNMSSVESDGLTFNMSITPGPYFLKEMLAIDLTIMNHSNMVYNAGPPFGASCGYDPGVEIDSTGKPDFDIPIATDHSCPAPGFSVTPLEPGQTLTVHRYFALQYTGWVTLTGEVSLYKKQVGENQKFPNYQPLDPFHGHRPTILMHVDPNVPVHRTFSYQLESSHVTVVAPPQVLSQLVYLYGISCYDIPNTGYTVTGNFGWYPLSAPSLGVPGCPGKHVDWWFAFGAPGYAVVVGEYRT